MSDSTSTPDTLATGRSGTAGVTPLLEIRDLQVGFRTQDGIVPAVRGVNLDIMPGETLAIVGESGSGKSTTAHAIINLLPGSGTITGGQILFEGRDLTKLGRAEMEAVRGRLIGLVPQDPMSNLNPVWSIGFQVEEAIRANGIATNRREVKKRAIEVLRNAGLADADKRFRQFPHEFSGGMRQRVLIGIGLSADPKLLIADEPTSALDVTVQRKVLDHLETLTSNQNTALMFITHDLGLAAERAENIVVMYRGRIVESGPALEILQNPQHPYTQRLVAAAPSLASRRIQSQVHSASHTIESGAADAVAGVDLVSAAATHADAVAETASNAVPAIEFTSVSKVFQIRGGGVRSTPFTAVDDVSFKVRKGTTMALVGESGSGKSTVAKLLLRLEQQSKGSILIDGKDTAKQSANELFQMRSKMQPVFQDPYGSLDPLRNIGNTIGEPLHVHKLGNKASRKARVLEILDQVALPQSVFTRYPNELSGGQRQRVAIARALALKPEIVVLDEAVSALDVLVQAQILNLLADLQSELGLTYLFITHDLAVVRVIADEVCVMQKGKIVETASVGEVFDNPKSEYTKELLDAIPGAGIELAL
jgi:peptide/nickel transport system ATP-binding protein